MNKKSGTSKDSAYRLVKGIKRKTRKHYSAEEKIRIVLAGLRGDESITALCRRKGISERSNRAVPPPKNHAGGGAGRRHGQGIYL